MSRSIQDLRKLIIECIDNAISSKKLGDWAYRAWFYYMEDKGKNQKVDKQFLDFLLELSCEWGFISSINKNASFQKEYLQNLLKRIEKFMNIEENSDY
jgi:hypothetical protein